MRTTLLIRTVLFTLMVIWYTHSYAQLSVKRSFDKQSKELTVTLQNQYNTKICIIQPYFTENITNFYIHIINDEFRRDSKAQSSAIYPDSPNQPVILRFHHDENFCIKPNSSYSVKFNLNDIPDKKGLKETGSSGKIVYNILDKDDNPIKMGRLKIEEEYFDYY